MILLDGGLQFAIYCEVRSLVRARAPDVLAPRSKLFATLFDRRRFVVSDVVHLAAERVKGGHTIALGSGQKDKRQRQIGGALARDGAAFFHAQGGSSK